VTSVSGTTESFTRIVDGLYAGTLDEAAWDRAIIEIADTVRASGALLLAFNARTGEVLREENHRFDPNTVEEYRQYWTFEDCRREHFLAAPVGCPTTEMTLQIPDWNRSPILNEFLRPADAPHFMPAWLHKSESKAVALSFQGTRKRGPFEAMDIESFQRVLPHVSRALEIRDRLQSAQIRADTLAESINGLRFGVMVLDGAGRLLECNGVAEEHLRNGEGVCRKIDGTLCWHEPAGGQFARWIQLGEQPRGVDGLLHARRLSALPLSLMVSPLPTQRIAWITQDPRWLVLIFDPERRIEASLEIIARDLGISGSEANVTALLAAGYRLHEVARRLRVSEHTVRSQLKSIFRKTGARTQAELIRRIAMGPAVVRHT
jgi:DNA-binding CsgD family transcriptional regulator